MVFEFVQRPLTSESGIRSAAANAASLEAITKSLAPWRSIVATGRGILVSTDCLYPDRSNVSVVVVGGRAGEAVVVHDDGGAEDRLAAAGRRSEGLHSTVRRVARRYGLDESDGKITSHPSPMSDLAALISLVANASQEAAAALMRQSQPREHRDLVAEMVQAFDRWRPALSVARDRRMRGASSREYKFDLVTEVSDGWLMLIHTVSPEGSSVNSAALANIDVGKRSDVKAVKVVVYENGLEQEFGPANLNLLSSVATTIGIDDFSVSLDHLSKPGSYSFG